MPGNSLPPMVGNSSCPLPANINPLNPNGFLMSIQRLPTVTYFAQSISLPAMSLGAAMQATPRVKVPWAGDQLTFEALTVKFLVDEQLLNYRALYDWMIALGAPEDPDQFASLVATTDISKTIAEASDATIQVLSGSNNPIQTIRIIDAVPTQLDGFDLIANADQVQYITGTVTFDIQRYEFVD